MHAQLVIGNVLYLKEISWPTSQDAKCSCRKPAHDAPNRRINASGCVGFSAEAAFFGHTVANLPIFPARSPASHPLLSAQGTP
jgi:hypothetical protein